MLARFLLAVTLLAAPATPTPETSTPDTSTTDPPATEPAPMQVLMIGNSYTNQIHASLDAWIDANPELDIAITEATNGGWTLVRHLNAANQPSYNRSDQRVSLNNLLDAQAYDVVVLQDQSLAAAGKSARGFERGVAELGTYVLERQATQHAGHKPRIVLYQTWARHPDWDKYDDDHTFDLMHERIQTRYRLAAEQHGHTLSPVGDAWVRFYQADPTARPDDITNLHQNDLSHPSAWDRALASLVILQSITGRDLADAPSPDLPQLGKPTDEQRAFLQQLTTPAPIPASQP